MNDETKLSTTVTRILELSRHDPARLKDLETFKHSVAVLFTDIQGSTAYYEKFGDLTGLAMVYECNSLLERVVRKHGGRVVKKIGDAIMATFNNCEACVRTAVEMQQQLKELNVSKKEEDQIHVRIGAHYGLGIVKSDDVFGDVVNVASRVQSVALPEQILISDSLFREVVSSGFDTALLGRFQLKGKAEEREIYEVRWTRDLPARPNLGHTVVVSSTSETQEFRLQHVTQDGKTDAEYALFGEGLTIGRIEGDMKFPGDSSMSPLHARIYVQHGQPMVEDLGSRRGIFFRLKGVFTLEDRDIIIIGGQLLRFESKPEIIAAAATMAVTLPFVTHTLREDAARFVRLNSDGYDQEIFSVNEDEIRFGRTVGDYTFPNDRFMSRTHARIYMRGENYFVEDLGSLNGTFARVQRKSPIPVGATVRIGKEVFVVA